MRYASIALFFAGYRENTEKALSHNIIRIYYGHINTFIIFVIPYLYNLIHCFNINYSVKYICRVRCVFGRERFNGGGQVNNELDRKTSNTLWRIPLFRLDDDTAIAIYLSTPYYCPDE